jgi:adenylyltransferase/sulfurtransferase
VRAGVGQLRLIDFDCVHETNLGDQCLFTTADAAALESKVEAAAKLLRRFNPDVTVEPVVAMFERDNAAQYASGADVIIDGTDNLETKYLINDVAVKAGTPWVYGGCVGRNGSVLAVIPDQTPCLRCIWPEPPALANAATCSAIGLLPTTPAFAAALQVTEALKILIGRADEVRPGPLLLDLWRATILTPSARRHRRPDCPACGLRRFSYLDGAAANADGSYWSPSVGL